MLTLLAHLGYLTYEEESDSCDDDLVAGLVRIPNEEVRSEFDKILRRAKHKNLIDPVNKSDQLLSDTLEGNCDAAAKAITDVSKVLADYGGKIILVGVTYQADTKAYECVIKAYSRTA